MNMTCITTEKTMMPELFYQLNTLCLCLSHDLPEAADVNDLRLVRRQTFTTASKRDVDGLINAWNTPDGLNMRNI